MADSVYVHPTALNESEQVGAGTRIWAFAHVMKGAVVGRDCNIGDHVYVESGVILGDGVTVKNGVSLWDGVSLEDFVFVGPNAVFTNDKYPRSPRSPAAVERYRMREWLLPTTIREGATVGANATVVCGVTIGRYATVGAAALVLKDVPSFALVVGSPAKEVARVCMCGRPLPDDTSPTCVVCGRAYRKDGAGLSPCDSENAARP